MNTITFNDLIFDWVENHCILGKICQSPYVHEIIWVPLADSPKKCYVTADQFDQDQSKRIHATDPQFFDKLEGVIRDHVSNCEICKFIMDSK